ncbi:hypothetical protein [Paenibacillus faecalis]|uniref:hypothetical protein n=1 Tax=Paenibacillus faecalis TaxID=2079532 RepID=UPI001F287C77|nr:hypothetical protein [Paenibacillus faecalis]
MTIPDDKHSRAHQRWFDYAEILGNLLLKSIPWVAMMLLIFQLLLRIDSVRPFLSPVYRMEGVPIEAPNVKDWMDEKKPSFLHHSS